MELDPSTIDLYVRHAFAGMNRVLDRLDDDTVNRTPDGWGTNSVAGLIVHCCELAPSWFEMPGLGRDSVRDREAEFATTGTLAELRTRIDVAVAPDGSVVDEVPVEADGGAEALPEFLLDGARRQEAAEIGRAHV
mgnify:CR=1 FL=1